VKFQLPGGATADVLANSIEGFVARTPEEFLAFLRAQLPDPATGKPAPDALPTFLGSHPAAQAFIGRLMQKPGPASYARTSYHAEHAFLFTAADASRRFGRYHFVPEAGETSLSPDDAGRRSPNFLREELESRLRNGPAVCRLFLQVATEPDPPPTPSPTTSAARGPERVS
jgi:catalase